jgi:hypothetical protein
MINQILKIKYLLYLKNILVFIIQIEGLTAIYLNTRIAIINKAPNIDAKIPIVSPILSDAPRSFKGSHN